MVNKWVTLGAMTLAERDEELKSMIDLLMPNVEHIKVLLDVYSEIINDEEQRGDEESVQSLSVVLGCLMFSFNVLSGVDRGDLSLLRKTKTEK